MKVLKQIAKQSVTGNKKKNKTEVRFKKKINQQTCTYQPSTGTRREKRCKWLQWPTQTFRLILLADETFTGESCIY